MSQTDILKRAAESLGGLERLAAFLNVPAADLRAWIAEKHVPPREIVAIAFDVIAEGLAEMKKF
jgi:hypothetical protein